MQSSNRKSAQSDFQRINLEDLRSLQDEPSAGFYRARLVIREAGARALEWVLKGAMEPGALASAEH